MRFPPKHMEKLLFIIEVLWVDVRIYFLTHAHQVFWCYSLGHLNIKRPV